MQIEVSQIPHRFRNRFLRDNNGGNVTYNSGSTINNSTTNSFNPVNIWGQYFDDSEDINGSMEVQGDITATGTVTAPNIDTSTLTASTLTAANGTIQTLDSSTINTHNLTVTGSAHFFELIIDKLKSVGGTVILSAANAKVDKVVSVAGGYKLYWRKEDADRAKAISNDFAVNDQVICMSFNAQTGVSHNVSNKYYWRLVTAVGDEQTTINGETVSANYIVVSDSVKDGDSVPEVADEIMQLGYRGSDDAERQSAIIFSAYKSPDNGIQSPAIVQYSGINDFNLSSHRYTYLAHNGNVLRGNLKVENGTSVEDLITEFAVDEDAIIARINSSLGPTGIDIINQKITLTATNTEIIGNLNLYDSQNNGLTVYDDSSVARVNIQSDALDSIAEIAANDTYTTYLLSTEATVSSWDLTTATRQLNFSANTTVDIDKYSLYMSGSNNGNSVYPTAQTTTLILTITDPSGAVFSKTITTNKSDDYGRYVNTNESVRYVVTHGGLHTIKYRAVNSTTLSGSITGYLNVNSRWQTASEVQTFIGRDGLYCHSGANKLLWMSENETQLRYGYNGIRWNDADRFNNSAMEVAASIKGTTPNYKPVWVPFYNFCPMFDVGTGDNVYTYQHVSNINDERWAFAINPIEHRGICYVTYHATDENHNTQESWIILPFDSFRDSDGDWVSLPVGYMVTVINDSGGSVFVTPEATSSHHAKIVDANRNENWYSEINGTQSNDTFIYVGTFSGVSTWRQMHDTQ